MATIWEQKQILRNIVDGLNAAVAEQGLDPEEIDPIKLNKLLYLAVDHFDLPVTYWWYKYGSDFTFHGIGPESVKPKALKELPTPTQPRLGPDDLDEDEGYPSPEQYKDFYVNHVQDLERLFEDDTKEYLRSFYRNYAPAELEDLYTACAVFQKTLDSIGYADNASEKTSEEIDTILQELRELDREVHIHPHLEDIQDEYSTYTELLKDVLVTVDEIEGRLGESEEVYRDLIRFFYDGAWQIVAFKIASQNSHGSDAFERKEVANGRLQTLLDDWENDITGLRNRCERYELIADEFKSYEQPIAREASQSTKRELIDRARKEWDGVSREASRDL